MKDFKLEFLIEPDREKFGDKMPLDKLKRYNYRHLDELQYAMQERLENRKGAKIENSQGGA